MPPSLRDWVPEGHLVWTVLDAVGELDLSAIYADYRDDGRGRPAYEPSMMVALLLYAYARGNRSSRGIERACIEDIAYRIVAGNLAPDHSTIAEFRCRHERPLGEVFSGVLGLCARAWVTVRGEIHIRIPRTLRFPSSSEAQVSGSSPVDHRTTALVEKERSRTGRPLLVRRRGAGMDRRHFRSHRRARAALETTVVLAAVDAAVIAPRAT